MHVGVEPVWGRQGASSSRNRRGAWCYAYPRAVMARARHVVAGAAGSGPNAARKYGSHAAGGRPSRQRCRHAAPFQVVRGPPTGDGACVLQRAEQHALRTLGYAGHCSRRHRSNCFRGYWRLHPRGPRGCLGCERCGAGAFPTVRSAARGRGAEAAARGARQRGRVVSLARAVAGPEGTRVTLPAGMPANPSHYRSGAALYYVIAGTGAFTADGKTEPRAAGAPHFEPYGWVHQWANPGDTPLVLLQANISQEGVPAVLPGIPPAVPK
jgi:mannose-6-phosphate isomerase-like protein (cupin superfamily)